MKQTIAATSSNHSEILAIHDASHECVWLRSMTQHIRVDCGISEGKDAPTVMYEDNATCIAQLKEGYIKGDRTKHILPKLFFKHELQKIFRTGGVIHVVLFFLHHGFVPLGFPGKVLMRQHPKRITNSVWL
ncbi:hypothetical protein Bca101_003261 [Brassica carinata]